MPTRERKGATLGLIDGVCMNTTAKIAPAEEADIPYTLESIPIPERDSNQNAQVDSRLTVDQKLYEQLRKTPTSVDLELTEEAKRFMASLDLSVRPIETAKQFPRIVNRIASLWKKPFLMDGYFEDLLIDKRGNRQGFPLRIAGEITALQAHYSTIVSPKTTETIDTIWERTFS
jgi:hypothetical protein